MLARRPPRAPAVAGRFVRDALDLHDGDEVVFRVQASAVVAKTPDFIDLSGSVAVPSGKRGTAWDDVLRHRV